MEAAGSKSAKNGLCKPSAVPRASEMRPRSAWPTPPPTRCWRGGHRPYGGLVHRFLCDMHRNDHPPRQLGVMPIHVRNLQWRRHIRITHHTIPHAVHRTGTAIRVVGREEDKRASARITHHMSEGRATDLERHDEWLIRGSLSSCQRGPQLVGPHHREELVSLPGDRCLSPQDQPSLLHGLQTRHVRRERTLSRSRARSSDGCPYVDITRAPPSVWPSWIATSACDTPSSSRCVAQKWRSS